MTIMTTNKYAPEARDHAVRMVLDHERATYRDGQRRDPLRLWARARRNLALRIEVRRVS
jgi:hypothetical protein